MTRGGPLSAALPELEFRNGRFALHERRRRSAKNRALQQAGHVVGHVEEPQIEARRDPNGDLARHADLDPAAPRVAQQARELPRVGEVGVEEAEAHVQLRGGRGPEALPGDAGPALLGVQHEDLLPLRIPLPNLQIQTLEDDARRQRVEDPRIRDEPGGADVGLDPVDEPSARRHEAEAQRQAVQHRAHERVAAGGRGAVHHHGHGMLRLDVVQDEGLDCALVVGPVLQLEAQGEGVVAGREPERRDPREAKGPRSVRHVVHRRRIQAGREEGGVEEVHLHADAQDARLAAGARDAEQGDGVGLLGEPAHALELHALLEGHAPQVERQHAEGPAEDIHGRAENPDGGLAGHD
eukprot:CAMPEP_0176250230 /NCGR_PEP_ID=MMETSP0121_2-20121125/34379_1 /TAXON_ID=160619 /ORGANISM="Kryptoperidinium foliaceum, Strain CCMP 1326" /LENGTH=351 /DNA_ID=CAMNT_0017589941 /DNA_START=29 /DNA_END=1081 /DNA_ORIENTATION=-